MRPRVPWEPGVMAATESGGQLGADASSQRARGDQVCGSDCCLGNFRACQGQHKLKSVSAPVILRIVTRALLGQALFAQASGLFLSRLAFGIYDEPCLSIGPFVFFLIDKSVFHPALPSGF